jgi:hypothetical protein
VGSSVVDDYTSKEKFTAKEFSKMKKNARYIMFQCQKDHFIKESD